MFDGLKNEELFAEVAKMQYTCAYGVASTLDHYSLCTRTLHNCAIPAVSLFSPPWLLPHTTIQLPLSSSLKLRLLLSILDLVAFVSTYAYYTRTGAYNL